MTAAVIVLKATLVMAGALLAVGVARRARASVRHMTLASAFAVLLFLPLAVVIGASLSLEVPVALAPQTSAQVRPTVTDDLAWSDLVIARPAATPYQADIGSAGRIAWVWGLGVVFSLLPVGAGIVQMQRYRRLGIPRLRQQRALRTLAANRGISRPIEVLVHESVAGPMTYGVWRPVVFLPPDSDWWDHNRLRRALVHELAHIQRADALIHCASRIVCACYWFHPLAWTMWRRLSLEAERACDDAVLSAGGDADATRYAEQLVDVAERLSAGARRRLLAMASRDDLATRISAVLDPTVRRGPAGASSTAAVLAAALCVVAIAPLRAVTLALPGAQRIGLATPAQATATAAPRVEIPFRPGPPAAARLSAQSASAALPSGNVGPPTFAVASVKINRSGDRAIQAPPVAGGRFIRRNIPIDVLIANAYAPLQRFEIEGVPEWATTTRVDVEALAEGPVTGVVTPAGASPAQINAMLQSLLAERFQLRVHREVRQQPVYALIQARAGQFGPQLQPHTDDSACVDPRAAAPAISAVDPNQPLPSAPCGAFRGAPALGRLRGQGVQLEVFGRSLSGQLGRLVIDRTGLMGTWDLLMEWTPLQAVPGLDPNAGAGSSIGASDRPSIFTAIQEQLGLKLEPTTGPVNMLIVDRVELPSEN